MSPINSQLIPNEVTMHRIDAIQISRVSGSSKSNSFKPLYFFSEMAWLMKYEAPDMKSIKNRMAKIQTINLAWISTLGTARVMNEIRATPVTPYVSNPVGRGADPNRPHFPPVQSAITPGFRGSSSLTLNTIFIKSEPMSAIFVKIPPAIRSTEAPSDSPMANPRKQYPTISPWYGQQDNDHHDQFQRNQEQADRHPGSQAGILTTSHGSHRAVRRERRATDGVGIHADAVVGRSQYEPPIPTTEKQQDKASRCLILAGLAIP